MKKVKQGFMRTKKEMRNYAVRFVETCEIEVTVIPFEVLKRESVNKYNNIATDNCKGHIFYSMYGGVPVSILTDYVRHNLTNYEQLIKKVNSCNLPRYYLSDNIIPVLRNRVNKKIIEMYGLKTKEEGT